MRSAHRRVHTHMQSLTLAHWTTHRYKQSPMLKSFSNKQKFMDFSLQRKNMLEHVLNSLSSLCKSSSEHLIIRPRGYNHVPAESSRFLLSRRRLQFLDPQGFRAARFPQLWRAALMISNPLSDWPKALIRISIPVAPGAWAGHQPIPTARLLGYNTWI